MFSIAQRHLQAVGRNLDAHFAAKPEDTQGEVCNGGKCASVPPLVAILTLLTGGLVDELKKDQPFGPNNDIMKALHSIGGFIQCIFGCK